jgi:hypothetical protein
VRRVGRKVEEFRGLPLEKGVREALLWGTAERVYGCTTR